MFVRMRVHNRSWACFVSENSEMEKVSVEGLDDLLAAVKQREGRVLYLFFCGTRSPETGESWCPDCVKG